MELDWTDETAHRMINIRTIHSNHAFREERRPLSSGVPFRQSGSRLETISDIKELGTGHTGELTAEARTGSFLACNSDSGSLSLLG